MRYEIRAVDMSGAYHVVGQAPNVADARAIARRVKAAGVVVFDTRTGEHVRWR